MSNPQNKRKKKSAGAAENSNSQRKNRSARRRMAARRRRQFNKVDQVRQDFDLQPKKRWGLNVSGLNLGPFGVEKLKFNSRNQIMGMGEIVPEDVQEIMPRMIKSPYREDADLLFGTEIVGSPTAVAGYEPGDVITKFEISPQAFPKTRLLQFGQLYQRYVIRKMLFKWVGTTPTTVGGGFIAFPDEDINNKLPDSDPANVEIAASHAGQRGDNIWRNRTWEFKRTDPFTSLYCELTGDIDPRLVYAGVFYMICSSPIAAGTTMGNWYIDYEIEFYIPRLSASSLRSPQRLLLKSTNSAITVESPFGSAVAAYTDADLESTLSYSYLSDSSGSHFSLAKVPLGYYSLFVGGHYEFVSVTAAGQVSLDVSITGADSVELLPSITDYSMASGGICTVDSYGGYYGIIAVTENPLTVDVSFVTTGDGSLSENEIDDFYFILLSLTDLSPIIPTSSRALKGFKIHNSAQAMKKRIKDVEELTNQVESQKEELDDLRSTIKNFQEFLVRNSSSIVSSNITTSTDGSSGEGPVYRPTDRVGRQCVECSLHVARGGDKEKN